MKTSENKRKVKVGTVVSDKMDKTIVVSVERIYRDARLQKTIKTQKKYKVHDENQLAKSGDFVEIYEGRPLSKSKYMYLEKVLRLNKYSNRKKVA